MAKYACPSCGVELLYEQLNIKEAVALCQSCGTLSKLPDVMEQAEVEQGILEIPAGCSLTDNGHGLLIRAKLRTVGNVLMTLGFAAFWNGITMIFLVTVIASTLQHTIGYVPKYFPAPEMDGEPMSVGMTSFLWLFLSPFIIIGIFLMGSFLLAVFGRIDIRITPNAASVRTGFPVIGWTRKFEPAKVTNVSVVDAWMQSDDRDEKNVRIDAGKVIKFGHLLPDERVNWLRSVLKVVLLTPNSEKYDELMKQSQSRLRY